MAVVLPRGYPIRDRCKIRKAVSSGPEWCIFATDEDTYALVITPPLLDKWSGYYDGEIFRQLADHPLYSFVSVSSEYLVSTLGDGPFPDRLDQVVAFSSAFGEFTSKHPTCFFLDAVYIEELSLILPLDEAGASEDMAISYGKWLTGGVSISGNDLGRLSSFMTWLPQKKLAECAATAGITRTSRIERQPSPGAKERDTKRFQLIGRPELERFFLDSILDVIENEEAYSKMGISFPGATVLHGPPGCGKTYAVDRLTDYLGWPRLSIEAGTIASPYIHDTSKKIAEVFGEAIKCSPSVLVIDEMEAFLSSRSDVSSGNHHMEEVAEFLRRIPEAVEHHVLIFAMTNMIESIDPAILRRGRFDHIVEVKMATTEEIAELLDRSFEQLPIASDVYANKIAEKLNGRPLSDVAYLLKEAGRVAVREQKDVIDNDCFIKAYQNMPRVEKKSSRRIGF